jgi:hypothetical protein
LGANIFHVCGNAIGLCGTNSRFFYIESGWLTGQTIWSLLYGTTVLATIFCVLIVILHTRQVRRALLTFRIISLCGFILLTFLFRGLVVDNPTPPDGLVLIDRYSESLTTWPVSARTVLEFDSIDDLYTSGRPACVFIDKNTLVIPEIFMEGDGRQKRSPFWAAMEKGALIRRLQSHQTNLYIPDSELEPFRDALAVKTPLYGWRDNLMVIQSRFPTEE